MVFAGTENLLRDVPVNEVKGFMKDYVGFLKSKHPETMLAIKSGKIDKEITDVLKEAAKDLSSKYSQ